MSRGLSYGYSSPVNVYEEFCVLIPTRNRPREVEALLTSIGASRVKPFQVVLVSSGEDISNTVEKFVDELAITYIHSEIPGQINQKKLGFSAVDSSADWVVFLDDDLLVLPDTFEKAFECVQRLDRKNGKRLGGVGFGLPATSRFNNHGKASQILARLFGINNQPAGVVLSNGHATSYLEQQETTETQWLNGASMWRVEAVADYGSHGISSKYAACEDLIFSYPVGKRCLLVYCPNAKIEFQKSEKTDFENPSIYVSALYWRYFFILKHKEFSIIRFNFAQLGRFLFGVMQNRGGRIKFISTGFPATFHVAMDSLLKRDSRKFLESI
jgi:glycosyltransferase involved in cell wall biosynthesis